MIYSKALGAGGVGGGVPPTGGWDVSTAVYNGEKVFVGTQDTSTRNPFFKPDGTKMYTTGGIGANIYEYDLSTPWDVSTAVYLRLKSVSAQDTNPSGLFFRADGAKMYITGATGDEVDEYNLSTPWDVTTAVYLQVKSVAAQDTAPWSLFFKPDGTKMYVTGAIGDDVNEYNLSTPWDVSTAVFLQLKSIAAQETTPFGLFFKPDGTKMYVTGFNGNKINEYDLSTPWNITTAVFLQLFDVTSYDNIVTGVFFKPDGKKMYVMGSQYDYVYAYNLT